MYWKKRLETQQDFVFSPKANSTLVNLNLTRELLFKCTWIQASVSDVKASLQRYHLLEGYTLYIFPYLMHFGHLHQLNKKGQSELFSNRCLLHFNVGNYLLVSFWTDWSIQRPPEDAALNISLWQSSFIMFYILSSLAAHNSRTLSPFLVSERVGAYNKH